MISGREFAVALERHGFDFFTGVPCSLVEDLIATLERGTRAPYVAAVREDAAVGVAVGAWFGGRRPVVLMQNSGLGTSLNALASLSLMYGLPALLVVTWRGYAGKDAPEHLLMGEISPALLDLLGIPHRVLAVESLDTDLAWAARAMDERMQPVALLVPPRIVETGAAGEGPRVLATVPRAAAARPAETPLPPATMTRLTALGITLKAIGEAPVLHANGYICRESFSLADRPQSFYMIGSMGLAPAIALGLTLARPGRRAVVFDGDGNLLMNLGILAMIGALRPPDLLHLVFDNEVYGSTGNQASPSRAVRLDRVAAAAGFAGAAAVADPLALETALRAAAAAPGPHFILVKVTAEEAEVPRIPYTPAALRDRFRSGLLA
ncbi:MAG TPA: thiamine pyrophosphate-dependent enzyme [Methylomirabilota bacterium]|nr:thiamine pyrophosphate-dependent enzyme [Methylomirabilota bacterium]